MDGAKGADEIVVRNHQLKTCDIYKTHVLCLNKPCDIIFSKGQVFFTKFALFILMIYVKKLELIQVASMVRYHTILKAPF